MSEYAALIKHCRAMRDKMQDQAAAANVMSQVLDQSRAFEKLLKTSSAETVALFLFAGKNVVPTPPSDT